MALTISFVKGSDGHFGALRSMLMDITFDASYPTGGEAIAASDVGLKAIEGMDRFGGNAAGGALLAHWDTTNKKLMLFYPSGGSATPATIIAPATTVPAGGTAVTSTAAQPDLVETAGIGKELANATDASTITVRMFIIGF